MAVDIQPTIDVLKEALLRELGGEVDLIFSYGSQLKDTTHQYSDLDISYVPVHETTGYSITVLVDETMIDLYPIHWSHLERMANLEDVSCTVLLENEIVYQRTDAVAARFRALPDRLHQLQQPAARPEMIKKAQDIFQRTAYQFYLLQGQAAEDHMLACMYHARNILRDVLHSLMVCNQRIIDTRKLDQVLSLPRLPEGLAENIEIITWQTEPDVILAATEELLASTRRLLLDEQHAIAWQKKAFADVFHNAYPELKGDLQHIMLACERRDMFHFPLMSLYHELMIHMAQALKGVEYSGFNSLAEYEQNLTDLGFPDLLPYVAQADFDGLHKQCQVFDECLQQYLTEYGVALNSFATLDGLSKYLNT